MTAYDGSHWADLFVASAGASAAPRGHVFVAASINVERIIKFPGLPESALETVLLLLAAVLVSLIRSRLVPGQGSVAVGIELLVVSLIFAAVIGALSTKSLPQGSEPASWLRSRLILRAAGIVLFVVSGPASS